MSQINYCNDHSEAVEGDIYNKRWDAVATSTRLMNKDERERLEKNLITDAVNHPSHYTAGKVECIDALEAATTGLVGIEAVCTANAIKYLWRWKHKNGVTDLKKAQWYINRLIERMEKE